MSTQDQAAQQWAQANPKDPRSQHILAKAWANQNPEDPRSAQILDKITQANSTPPPQPENNTPPQSPNPAQNSPPKVQDPQPNPFNVSTTQQQSEDKQQQLDRYKKMIDTPIEQGGTAVSPQTVNQIGAQSLLPGMGSQLAQGMGGLGRIGIGSAIGATQGAVNSPSSPLAGAAAGGIAGAVGSSALEGLQSLLGGMKGAASNISTAMQIHKADPDLLNAAKAKIQEASEALSNPGPGQNQGGADYLSNKLKSPVTALTSNNFDKRATINDLGEQSGTDLADYAKQLRSAKKTANNPIKSGIGQTLKMGVAGAADSLSSGPGIANDPRTLSAILSALTNK